MMSKLPEVGEIFELTILWPESIQKELGTPTIVTARREPDLTDAEVMEQRVAGKLKQLYQIAEFDTHRVVSFKNECWVYDFLGLDVTFTGPFIFPGGEN